MRIERLVVFKRMGGLSPSMELVTSIYRKRESLMSHISESNRLDERDKEASLAFSKLVAYGI
jgi:hypothetical protein